MRKETIKKALELIFQEIERLRVEFPEKEFTIGGKPETCAAFNAAGALGEHCNDR